MEKIFEQYLYTDEDKLLDDANRIAFGEKNDNGVTKVESEKVKWLWSMDEINAIVSTISFITNDKYLGTYMSGAYLGLQVILNGNKITDFKKEAWNVFTSPKISTSKIANLKAHEIVPILISLNLHRELWKESFYDDASKYF